MRRVTLQDKLFMKDAIKISKKIAKLCKTSVEGEFMDTSIISTIEKMYGISFATYNTEIPATLHRCMEKKGNK